LKSLVIIPTYNEADNIIPLVQEVFEYCPEVNVLVVDDSSPDGTANLVEELAQKEGRLFLLKRGKKSGLGRAYIAGFEWGIQRGYGFLVEMDADFSHRPADLKLLLLAAQDCDAAVGSRYIAGGGVENWVWTRKALSKAGSMYARCILGYPLSDWTGGFNVWRAETLKVIGLENIKSDGYSFQIELKYRTLEKGFKLVEVPILFLERREGQSKMSGRIVREALYRVWKMKFEKI